jgi:hypothetical protein
MSPPKFGSGLFEKKSLSHLIAPYRGPSGADIGRSSGGPLGILRDLYGQLASLFLHGAAIQVEEFTNLPASDDDAFIVNRATATTAESLVPNGAAGTARLATPRNILVTTTGADTEFNFPLNVTVTGTYNGRPQTEVISLAAGESPGTKAGVKPFDSVSRVQISANLTTSGFIKVGTGVGIGTKRKPLARAGLTAPIREISGGSAVTNGTLSTDGLYVPSSAPDGSRDYAIFYEADVSELLARHRDQGLALLGGQRREALRLNLPLHRSFLRCLRLEPAGFPAMESEEPLKPGVLVGGIHALQASRGRSGSAGPGSRTLAPSDACPSRRAETRTPSSGARDARQGGA